MIEMIATGGGGSGEARAESAPAAVRGGAEIRCRLTFEAAVGRLVRRRSTATVAAAPAVGGPSGCGISLWLVA